ncbi:glycoprotein-N-acetylgalactosamine 3-beta-galactosyltransferase 1-like isoform X2 [Daphnia pulicaria]|uniref:glycoprotein-N-acetylgalactosamine 3-beta-galactosyltransferase 1-like isoform X2 n=1 Tax=Daphnia pulicaria TaxID=35523 RepID=UPI001EEC7F97|nr:glycoprotein-N-acetylgalactosamine 3-beta-galactosyltransferase 1-like isoform X2 [Daphnia pulicaria]
MHASSKLHSSSRSRIKHSNLKTLRPFCLRRSSYTESTKLPAASNTTLRSFLFLIDAVAPTQTLFRQKNRTVNYFCEQINISYTKMKMRFFKINLSLSCLRYWWIVTVFLGCCSLIGRFLPLNRTAVSIGDVITHSASPPIQQHRILCWIPISAKSKFRAQLIQKTWGKQCDVLLFLSSQADASIPAIGLPVEDAYSTLWGKTSEGLKYIYENHLNEADWFIKADDDTYVVVDNLRQFLMSHDISLPHFLGSRFAHNRLLKGYFGGGAGYVMTRETIRIFVEHVYNNGFDMCISGHNGEEDSYLAMCLEVFDVIFGDTRDCNGAERFLQLSLHNLYRPFDYQATLRAFFPSKLGIDCCSNQTISFHPVKDEQLLEYDYLVRYNQLIN